MKIVVPQEIEPGERRVALVPDTVASLIKLGLTVNVQAGAGAAAHFSDAAYQQAGATIVSEADALWVGADLVLGVQRPAATAVDRLGPGTVVVGLLQPSQNAALLAQFAARQVTALAVELIPRISRAQKMDVLSSQATVAGYQAALIAAGALPRFFPMLMTAAGTIPPAKVLVLGAGVAGLQAIATARRLGANVWGYDVRSAVKEQIESLGAKFLEFTLTTQDTEDKGGYAKELSAEDKARQQAWLAEKMKEFDAVITTALIPGRPAPKLITEATVAGMRPGSVIVDLAAETGGNCELTEPGRVVVKAGVTIHGTLNLPSTMPTHASQMYARNVVELVKLLVKDGQLHLDFADEIVQGACVTHAGKVR